MAFELPPLPYAYNSLEPHIDEETMRLHHDKHHQAYLTKFNAGLEKHVDLQKKSAEDILRGINTVPQDIRAVVRNHGGGYVNHKIFWNIMAPNAGGNPTGKIADAIKQTFGDFNAFKEKFNEAGAGHFGSGWVWLVRSKAGKLEIITTANQDSPFMEGHYPVFGNDLWEHAYYLKYRNVRPEYLKAWWNVTNWAEINKRLEESDKFLKAA